MYVCMYVFMYVCMYVFIYVCMYVCMYVCICYPYYPISLSEFQVAIFQEAFYQQLHNQTN